MARGTNTWKDQYDKLQSHHDEMMAMKDHMIALYKEDLAKSDARWNVLNEQYMKSVDNVTLLAKRLMELEALLRGSSRAVVRRYDNDTEE